MAKKLLVADDSLTIQKVIKLALSGDGYEIQTVSDGTECLQQIALFRPDVILVDIGLPGRSAFELKKAANEDPEMAQIPFVLMSSAFEKVDEAKVALLRFDGRLTKPFDPSNLKGVLAATLQMNSGQALKEFTPSTAPGSSGFSFDPPEKSRQVSRPHNPLPRPVLGEFDITNEIQLSDPKPLPGDSTPDFTNPDPLWAETPNLDSLGLGKPGSNDDLDIRNLTESTVKMSGLDDLGGWNIEENAKSSLPPIPDFFTTPSREAPSFEVGRSSAPPPAATPSRPTTGGGHDSASAFTSSQASLEELVQKQVREQLEILVQGAVKTQLEQMARKALPDIAERVVKAEIRKLLEGLSNPEA